MRLQTRLQKHLEPGWVLETPSTGYTEDPLTGNRIVAPPTQREVSVTIQQRPLTGMTETGALSVVDERVAVILPVVDVPPDAVLRSPAGQQWNAIGEGIVRRTAYRKPVYTVVSVRRAKEGDRA